MIERFGGHAEKTVIKERKICPDYNSACGEFFGIQRKKRNIPAKKAAHGIMSSVTLGRMEEGKEAWKKFSGDVLMHRIGMGTEYFETYVSAEELGRWKLREEIVLFILEYPDKAMQKVHDYQVKYLKLNCIERQFLLKIEAVHLILESLKKEVEQHGLDTQFAWCTYGSVFLRAILAGSKIDGAEKILKLAQKAISQTLKEDWMCGIQEYLLAPEELECFLLLIIGYRMNGNDKMAWQWWQRILYYVQGRELDDYVSALILPQMGLVGMMLLELREDDEGAYRLGKWTLESIRKVAFQNYAIPLLEQLSCLLRKHTDWKESECWDDYLTCFGELARRNQNIRYRLWQTASVTNTKEIGVTLKMLREANGWNQEETAEKIRGGLTRRQLARIESGENKPAFATYQEIMRLYCKEQAWYIPLLETNDGSILIEGQRVSTLMERWQLAEAEEAVEKLAKKIDLTLPRNKQEMLLWETNIQWKKYGKTLEECVKQYIKALRCTLPNVRVRDWKSWVFAREELNCICNVAAALRELGKVEEARQYYESLRCSLQQQMENIQIAPRGYEMLMHGYVNILRDLGEFRRAMEMDEEVLDCLSKRDSISNVEVFFWDLAQCAYELGKEHPEEEKSYRKIWEKNFRFSRISAMFTRNKRFLQFWEDEQKNL